MIKRIMGNFAKDLYRSQLPDGLRATSTPLPADYQFNSWDGALNDGHYDVYLSVPQNGLPAGIWFIDVQRHSMDTQNNQYRVITARSFSFGNVVDQIYQSTCTNAVWSQFVKIVINKSLVWHTPTLIGGWADYLGGGYAPVRYSKDDIGIVHIVGLVSGGSNATNTVIFILPTGFRPTYEQIHNNRASSGDFRVDITPAGEVQAMGVDLHTGNATLWLDIHMMFKAA